MTPPNARPLDELLRLVEHPEAPTMHAPEWHARIGAELTATIARLGILVRGDAVDWYPCGGPCGRGCPRRVVENRADRERPFTAVCGQIESACLDVLLLPEDREVLAFSLDGFIRALRRVLGVGGVVERDDAGFPGARRIGERAGRPVFVALTPASPGFEAWLAARGDALVLAPFGRGVATSVRDRFGAGQRVELVALRDVLRLEQGAILGAMQEPILAVREPSSAAYNVRSAVCVAIDPDGRRELNAEQYQALVARASEFALFVDTTVTVAGGGHRALRRNAAGVIEESSLTKHEAAALVELINTRKALRAGDFTTVSVNAIDKVVERARSKVDVKQGRYAWRAIHTLAGDTPEAKRWQFNPDAALTFALLIPVPP